MLEKHWSKRLIQTISIHYMQQSKQYFKTGAIVVFCLYVQQWVRDVGKLHWDVVMRPRLDIKCFGEAYKALIVEMQYGYTTTRISLPCWKKILEITWFISIALHIAMSLHLKIPLKLFQLIAEAQDSCEDLSVLVGITPKHVLLFENIQKEIDDGTDALRLTNSSQTRWTTRGSEAVMLIKKTQELQEALEIL